MSENNKTEWWTIERQNWAAEIGTTFVLLWIMVSAGLGILWIFVSLFTGPGILLTGPGIEKYALFFTLHQIILLILMTVVFTQIMARNVDLALEKQKRDERN